MSKSKNIEVFEKIFILDNRIFSQYLNPSIIIPPVDILTAGNLCIFFEYCMTNKSEKFIPRKNMIENTISLLTICSLISVNEKKANSIIDEFSKRFDYTINFVNDLKMYENYVFNKDLGKDNELIILSKYLEKIFGL